MSKRRKRTAKARRHLVVLRDARGLAQRVTLAAPIFDNPWQNDVAAAAASTAHGLFGDGRTLENAVETGRRAMAGTSKIAEGVLRLARDQAPACHSGCAHCCYQAVGVSAPELLAIHDHLQRTRTAEELELLTQRIRESDDRTRGMTSTERLSPDLPCPFLEQERCSIYEARPLACRGKNSLDAAACERSLHEPDARAKLVAGTFTVPCFLEPIRAFHAVAAGVQLALSELHGLQMAPLELTAGMRILIDDPEAATRRWLAGENPFEAARGGDASQNPRIRELSGRKAAD